MNELQLSQRPFWIRALPFLMIYSMYAIGFFLDVIEVDSAQYAELSREMLESGNFLQLYERGADYLDKPPLLFWLTAFFYRIFGVSVFVFRLPSFLFSLLGNYSTFRLARHYYGYDTGYLAALIAASCQAFFMFNHDVRMDTMLTGAVIFAIWQINEFIHSRRMVNLILGFTGIAAAMLTKGPIGLMVPVLAFSTDFVLKRQWKNFFRWEWLLGLAWTGLLLVPMCIGLYQQFDLHPEKVMYGQTGTSGLRFFFWTQSFGRLTGESTWHDDSDVFFFMHTFLWAFLPWSLLFIVAGFRRIKAIISSRFRIPATEEALTIGGFLFPYLAFTASRYQLPHYIFVLFPLAAIVSAHYLYQVLTRMPSAARIWRWVQGFVGVVVWTAGFLLALVVFPLHSWLLWLVIGVFVLLCGYALFQSNRLGHLFGFSLLSITGVNFILNAHFYPELLQYQSSSVAARYIRAQNIDLNHFYAYQVSPHPLDFGLQKVIPQFTDAPVSGNAWVFTHEAGMDTLRKQNRKIEVIKTFDEFHVSMLSLPFLNPNTRSNELKKMYLVKIEQ